LGEGEGKQEQVSYCRGGIGKKEYIRNKEIVTGK
jgi:hypothetical protein